MLKKYALIVLLASSQLPAETPMQKEEPTKKALSHGERIIIYALTLGGAILIAKGVGSVVYKLLPASLSSVAKRRIVMGVGGCIGFMVIPNEKLMEKIMKFFEDWKNKN